MFNEIDSISKEIKSENRSLRSISSADLKDFDPLPGTALEVELIGQMLPNHTKYTKQFANEKNFKEQFSNQRIIHLATHGFFLPDKPYFNAFDQRKLSGIVLSGDSENDGILFSKEVEELSNNNLDILVLSACETGLGTLSKGEGIAGLKSAFLKSGAKRLLVSNWKVNDIVTSEFMILFYKQLIRTSDYEKAYSIAVNRIKLKYPQPYFWGAFNLVLSN